MTDPNLAVSLPIREVQDAVSLIESLQLDIVDIIEIRGSEQILEIDISVEGPVTSETIGVGDEELSALLDRLKPEIKGSIRLGLGVSAGLADDSSEIISINLFPQFQSISIEEMTILSGLEITGAVDWLCCTYRVRDSFCESSMVAGLHEQTDTTNLQDQELASL